MLLCEACRLRRGIQPDAVRRPLPYDDPMPYDEPYNSNVEAGSKLGCEGGMKSLKGGFATRRGDFVFERHSTHFSGLTVIICN